MKKLLLMLFLILFMMTLLIGCNDESNAPSIKHEISLKNGVLPLVPELRMNMTFSEIPEKWIPPYEEAIGYSANAISFSSLQMYKEVVKYGGVEFYTYLRFDLELPILHLDEFDTKPLISEIICESVRDDLTYDEMNEFIKQLISQYGKPELNDVGNYFEWIDEPYSMILNTYEEYDKQAGILILLKFSSSMW